MSNNNSTQDNSVCDVNMEMGEVDKPEEANEKEGEQKMEETASVAQAMDRKEKAAAEDSKPAEDSKSAEEESSTSVLQSGKALAILLLIYALYLVLGGVIFHFIEFTNEQDSVIEHDNWMEEFLANNTCMTKQELYNIVKSVIKAYDQGIILTDNSTDSPDTSWDIASSIFFSTTIVTTIGYGNIAPATPGGRIFAVFYAIFGIPLFVVASGQLGVRLSKFSGSLAEKVGKKIKNDRARSILAPLVVFTLGFSVFSLCAAGIFAVVEGWTYSNAVYYTFITLTTIGLGDFYPSYAGGSNKSSVAILYRLFVSIWILCGLVWMASMISGLSDSLMGTVLKKAGKDKVTHTDTADENKNGGGEVKA